MSQTATATTTTALELNDLTPESGVISSRIQQGNERDDQDVASASRLIDTGAQEFKGYGWVVLVATSVINFWTTGTTYSWGILQAGLIKENSKLNASTAAWVGSLWVASVAIFALTNARLIRYLGARNAALAGIGFLGFGEILSGFTTQDIGGLFVTTGVIMGLGSSMCFMVNSIVPAQYFVKKRGLANGIVYAAAGLGGAIITIFMNALVSKLGPAWAYRITGCATLVTGAPAAWLLKERSPIRRAAFIDWSLLREVRFALIFLAGAIATFPLMVAPFFLPLYSKSVGLSTGTGAALVAAFNLSSAVGRIAFGFLCDRGGPINSLLLSQVLSAVSMLTIWPIADSLAPLIVFAIVNGMANGGFFSSMPTVVGNVFGSARVSVAMGMVVTSWVGGYLLGAPIAGYLLDAYGGPESSLQAYHPAIFYAGSMSLGAAGIVLAARFKINPSILAKV